jgi:hypothetical protein
MSHGGGSASVVYDASQFCGVVKASSSGGPAADLADEAQCEPAERSADIALADHRDPHDRQQPV